MGLLKMFCQAFVGLLLMFPLFILYRQVPAHFESVNIDKCRRIKAQSPNEDIIALPIDGTIVLGSDPLPEYMEFSAVYCKLPYVERIVETTKKYGRGRLTTVSKDGKSLRNVPITGYSHVDFHPHGINAVLHHGDEYLYVINHRRDGEFISIFKVVRNSQTKELESFAFYMDLTHSKWLILNDLAIVPKKDGAFYVTHWMRHDPGNFDGFRDILSKSTWGHLYLCGMGSRPLGRVPDTTKPLDIDCRVVASELPLANGVVLSNDLKNVVVTTTKGIVVFDRNTLTSELTLKRSIDIIGPMDNINVDRSTGHMYAASYPKPLGFWFASLKSPKGRTAAKILRLNAPDFEEYDTVFQSNGEMLSGASAGIVENGRLYATALLDSAVVVCEDGDF